MYVYIYVYIYIYVYTAFASILCSPSSPRTFKDMLLDIKDSDIPVALVYGKEDPWIVPIWVMNE